MNSDSTSTPSTEVRQTEDTSAWLASIPLSLRHDEFLVPVQGIIDVAQRILSEAKAQEQPSFLKDIAKLSESAVKLRTEFSRLLEGPNAPHQPGTTDHVSGKLDGSKAILEDDQRKVRHDLRNLLNPLINYPGLWIEQAEQYFLQEFVGDLELLQSLGQRCQLLVDEVLNAGATSVSDPTKLSDLKRVADLLNRFHHMADDRVVESGNVLVVDDSDVQRDILRRLLESQGHVVFEAQSGRDALDLLDSQPIDLVLLDIIMPDVDGYETLCLIKSSEHLRDIPVVMISALNEVDAVAGCIRLGAEDYLPRPYNPIVLKARVASCLEKSRFRAKEKRYLAEIEHERSRADKLLYVIYPDRVVEELKSTDRCIPRRFDNVAVMFADIVNFTTYCDRHEPEIVVEHLQKLFHQWEEASLEKNVQKIKTIGDAYMATCGLLIPEDRPVLRCMQLGTEMIRAVQGLPAGWNLRVGIHFGSVVAGVLGRRQALYDLFGDCVNTAARMESHGVPGSIVLSGAAFETVSDICEVEELPRIPVKGKGEIPRYRVISYSS